MGRHDFTCDDCGADLLAPNGHEWFMLFDEVWNMTGLGRGGGVLCVGCIEERIGRHLTECDFDPTLEINTPSTSDSDRLLLRRGLQKVRRLLPPTS